MAGTPLTASSAVMPDPSDAPAWEDYVRGIQAAAAERVHAEVERLRRANIIDDDGCVMSESTPPDMDPAAETSVVTG